MKRLGLSLLLIVGAGFLLAAQAAPRFALVIGNGDYTSYGNLKNPTNDAADIAAALGRLGFDVDLLTNAELPAMENAVIKLKSKLSANKNAIGAFFFAGHGIQSSGTNYLIPVRTEIADEVFLKTKALSAQSVLDLMQDSGNKLNLIFLDACRDNPFAWSRGGNRGLSVIGSQPPGSIIVYATSAGSVASDGQGRNGVFTGELLKNIETPGLDLNGMLDLTAQGVLRVTSSKQNPAIYKQYFETAYLAGAAKVAPANPTPAPVVIAPTPSPQAPSLPVAFQPAQRNLLVNPDGELMPVTKNGWRQLSGDWTLVPPIKSSGLDPNSGKSYFWGGASAKADLAQDVDLTSEIAAILAGEATLTLKGYLASFKGDEDTARLTMEALDASNKVVATADSGAKNYDVWTETVLTLDLPKTAVAARVHLITERKKGNDNDGFIDDLSLTVRRAYTPTVRLETSNFPGTFVVLRNNRGGIDSQLGSPADGQWRLVRGLGDPNGLSFESVTAPGFFLRHRGRDTEIWQDKYDGTVGFRSDATFWQRPGFASVDQSSFEAFDLPGKFLRHRNSVLYVDDIRSALDKADGSFRLQTLGLPGPTTTQPANVASVVPKPINFTPDFGFFRTDRILDADAGRKGSLYYDLYTFAGNRGDTISILANNNKSRPFDPLIRLIAASGDTIQVDPKKGSFGNLLRTVTLKETGQYQVVVGVESAEQLGPYHLEFSGPGKVFTGKLTMDSPRKSFDKFSPQEWYASVDIPAEKGVKYIISLSSNDFQTRLALENDRGGPWLMDNGKQAVDNGGKGNNTQIIFDNIYEGTMRIMIRNSNLAPVMNGTWRLEVTKVAK